jgi:hypothetical protein
VGIRQCGRLVCAALFFCCQKGRTAAPQNPTPPVVKTGAVSTFPAAPFRLSKEMLEGYLRYQPVRTKLLDRLAGLPRGGEDAVRALEARANADEAARAQAGLTYEEVRRMDALLAEVLEARSIAAALTADGAIEAWDKMREKLPDSQRADLDPAIEKMSREREEARGLSRARKEFGEANVDLLLTRERELTLNYNAWLSRLTGMAAAH